MEIIKFFDRDDSKYTNLYQNILLDSKILINDAKEDSLEDKTIISAINTKLERAVTHYQGLDLLSNFAPKISKESLLKYFPHWTSKVSQILTNAQSNSKELVAACCAINALVKSCKQVPDLDRKVSTYNIKQFIGIITEKFNKDKSKPLLDLLTVLVFYYPESCARFQVPLSQILSACIDNENKYLVVSGAKCYSYLISGAQNSFIHASKDNQLIFPDNKSASYHVSHQIILCNNLCTIIDELFQDIVTTSEQFYNFQSSTNINFLQLPKIYCIDILDYYSSMENRFTNICCYLSTLLKIGNDKGKKIVMPNIILQTICKGLMITPQNLRKNNDENEKSLLLFILPKLQMGLLDVLEALIESFQQELLSFTLTIQHLFLQILEWTQEFTETSFVDVRIYTYKILSSWLKLTGSLQGFQLTADEFLSSSLNDLSPINKNIVVLSTKEQKNGSIVKSKFQKTKEIKEVEDCNSSNNIIYNKKNSILYLNALSAIQSIISSSNYSVKPSFYNRVKKTVVLLLYELYIKQNLVFDDDKHLECKLQLLRTLRILQTYPHISISNPTSNAIQIFGIALSQDNDPKIKEEASLGLAELGYIINPTAPTLLFPKSEQTSTELTSSNLLHQIEIIHSSKPISNSHVSEDDSSILDKNVKRPRLEEDCKINTLTTNETESVNKENDASDFGNDDIMMSFQDIQQSV